ncbi:MAG TPA: TDP-N-acetylfucosamine:lipid II N-acetylfucosaminyltransferase [Allosphingosinicella sp.]|jgi:hypothetical protein|nr:TDP-N-acetylfucosamine:lipid II N-acetylfucosaminyltransferase [Allosphingosinicella sp.]
MSQRLEPTEYIHLVQDQKFVATAMRLFEQAAPGRHRWIVLADPAEGRHPEGASVEFERPEGLWRRDLRDRVVFIHLMNGRASRVVMGMHGPRFIWIAWGGDFYPFLFGSRLLGPKTKQIWPAPRSRLSRRLARGIFGWSIEHLPQALIRAAVRLLPLDVARTASVPALIRRCFGMIFVLPAEAELLRERLPDLRFRNFEWNYYSFGDEQLPPVPERGREPAVLIGNSATPEGNHLECLDLLEAVAQPFDVYIPLSYGTAGYREALKAALPPLPTHRLHLLEHFLPLRDYEAITNRCCYVIMGHKRQQAMGNIVYALAIGARVYLDPSNPIYDHFRVEGATIFTLEDFAGHAQEQAGWLDEAATHGNREVIRRLYGWPVAVEKTRELLAALEAAPAGGAVSGGASAIPAENAS